MKKFLNLIETFSIWFIVIPLIGLFFGVLTNVAYHSIVPAEEFDYEDEVAIEESF